MVVQLPRPWVTAWCQQREGEGGALRRPVRRWVRSAWSEAKITWSNKVKEASRIVLGNRNEALFHGDAWHDNKHRSANSSILLCIRCGVQLHTPICPNRPGDVLWPAAKRGREVGPKELTCLCMFPVFGRDRTLCSSGLVREGLGVVLCNRSDRVRSSIPFVYGTTVLGCFVSNAHKAHGWLVDRKRHRP